MRLTKEQDEMLNGAYGEAIAYAMRVQVGMGRIFGADRMVPITRTHVALSAQEADVWFAEKLQGMGGKCKIPPTVNPSINKGAFAPPQTDETPRRGARASHRSHVNR